MPKSRPPYPAEYRNKIVELARAGRAIPEIAAQFEPTEQTIRNWIAQADRDAGKRTDGVTSAEREELTRLRRENRQLKLEREILARPRPGSLGRPTRSPTRVRIREGESGRLSGGDDVPAARRFHERLLRLVRTAARGARDCQ